MPSITVSLTTPTTNFQYANAQNPWVNTDGFAGSGEASCVILTNIMGNTWTSQLGARVPPMAIPAGAILRGVVMSVTIRQTRDALTPTGVGVRFGADGYHTSFWLEAGPGPGFGASVPAHTWALGSETVTVGSPTNAAVIGLSEQRRIDVLEFFRNTPGFNPFGDTHVEMKLDAHNEDNDSTAYVIGGSVTVYYDMPTGVWDNWQGRSGATGDYLLDWPPPAVISDMMTDELYGGGIDPALIHTFSRDTMNDHTILYDLLVAGVLEVRQSLLSFSEQMMGYYLGWLAARQGQFYFGGRRPEPVTREIVLDDMLEEGLLTVSMAGERDTKNKITVDYSDRSRLYNTFPVYDSDDPDRAARRERAESISLLWFKTAARAKKMAALTLVLRRIPALVMEAILGPKEINMAPGDVAAVTLRKLGLNQEPVRILSVGESDREDQKGGFKVAMEREPAGLLTPTTYPIQPAVFSDPPAPPLEDPGPTLI